MTEVQRDKNFHYYAQTKNDLHLIQKMIKSDLEVMEDSMNKLAFRYLNPEKYRAIINHMEELYKEADYD